MTAASTGTKAGRLRQEFCETFDFRRAQAGRDPFRRWLKRKAEEERAKAREEGRAPQPPLEMANEAWPLIRSGKPVKLEYVQAYAEFLITTNRTNKPSHEIYEEVAAPPEEVDWGRDDAFRLGFEEMHEIVKRRLRSLTEANANLLPAVRFAEDEREVQEAAWIINTCAGRHLKGDKGLPDEEALKVAENVMKRSHEDYTRWLLQLWQHNKGIITIAVVHVGHTTQPIAVDVLIPVTKAAYKRIRAGEFDPFELTVGDILPKSRYLYHHAIFEVADSQYSNRFSRTTAQVYMLLYHQAVLCGDVRKPKMRPTIFAAIGTPENTQRSERFGLFHSIGTRTPRLLFDLCEIACPSTEEGKQQSLWVEYIYNLLMVVLWFLQRIEPSRKKKGRNA